MKKHKQSFRDAITLVKAKRKVVCPNLGFEMQLKHYEKQLLPDARNSRLCKTLIPSRRMIEFPDRPEVPAVGKNQVYGRFPQITANSKTSVRKKRDFGRLDISDKHSGRMTSQILNGPYSFMMCGTPGYNSCLSRNRDSILEPGKANSIHISRKLAQSREVEEENDLLMSSGKWMSSNISPKPAMKLSLRRVEGRSSLINSIKR
jgi:hypothetical protein